MVDERAEAAEDLEQDEEERKEKVALEKSADVLRQIIGLRRRPILLWCEPDDAVGEKSVRTLRRHFGPTLPKIPRLDILLYSPGGDIHAAYRSLLVLRQKVERITVLIPKEAKSAATVLALGADEILFGRDGELGPLDAQLRDPRGSRYRQSALNEFKSLEYIREYAAEAFDGMVEYMMGEHLMDVPHAIEAAECFYQAVTAPLYSQVRPSDLGRFRRSLSVAEEYGRRVMERWGYKRAAKETIEAVVHALVWNYPDHEFVIDVQEAQQLGLHAKVMPTELDRLCREFIETGMEILLPVGLPEPSVGRVGETPSSESAEVPAAEMPPDAGPTGEVDGNEPATLSTLERGGATNGPVKPVGTV